MENLNITKKKTNIYVTPKELIEEYNKSLILNEPTNKLILLFQKIAKHFCTQFEYKNKCDMDACINYAVSEAWQKWNKFNPEKSDNIFSFFTTMLSNDLRIHYKQLTKGKATQISIDALFSNNQE
jgi:hypothetical protein